MRLTAKRPDFRAESIPALAVALFGVSLAYYFRFGYRFGHGDQDEFLPLLVARLEGVLTGDWFVARQLSGFNVRTGFVWILEAPARLIGVEGAVMLLYILGSATIIAALFLLAKRLGASPLGCAVAALGVVALMPRWTLGGNAIASSMLVPSMLAWGLGLTGLLLVLNNREWAAGIAIGIAAWIQILVAAQIGALCLAGLLWRERKVGTPVLHFAAPALGLAAPVVTLLFLSETAASGSFDILARVRAPHHYLPGTFPARDFAQVGLLAIAGLFALQRTRLSRPASVNRFIHGALAAAGAGVAVGMFGWLAGIESVLLLQPFKTTLPAGAIFVCALGASLPRIRIPTWVWTGALVVIVGGWTLALRGYSVLGRPPADSSSIESTRLAELVSSLADADAVFAVPPSLSGFRFHSRRPVVVSFKAFPFGESQVTEWYNRILASSPGTLPDDPSGFVGGGAAVLGRLDQAYESLSPDGAADLVNRYQASFVVRRTAFPQPDSLFDLVGTEGSFRVYRLVADP